MRHPEWYPNWYKGGYPDVEKILREMFSRLLTGVTVVDYLESDFVERLQDGESFLRIARTSGHINGDQLRDQARVQTAALTPSRDDSWELIEFVRQTYEAVNHGGLFVDGVLLRETGEVVGPQLIPEQIRESRLVPVTHDIWVGHRNGAITDTYPQALQSMLRAS
ncbi:hypothetical protein B1R94_25965 [Mycolicibacterium litorale]|nr:hypothetical protein B1R94_25965 [Mycolicibacterium litorale]